jgi:hypothetical protein
MPCEAFLLSKESVYVAHTAAMKQRQPVRLPAHTNHHTSPTTKKGHAALDMLIHMKQNILESMTRGAMTGDTAEIRNDYC